MTPKKKFDLLKQSLKFDSITNASVFNTLRILKGINPGDAYYEAYLGHLNKRPDSFIDYYHVLWTIGSVIKPKKVMEIGCRTGISICQLLSSYVKDWPEKIVLCDLFADGLLSEGLVRLNLKHLNIPTDKIEFIIGDSTKKVPNFIKENKKLKFDYILVDGGHDRETAKKDLRNVIPLLAKGAIIIFDDISTDPGECGLIDVWEEFKEEYENEFFFTENMNGKGVGIGVKK